MYHPPIRQVKVVKINEVEALVGIPKKNIRFYETQQLLSPRRNAENGYREYSDEDVATLRRIKLLRKLGVPIGEIQQVLHGTHTVGDCIRRHLITLEREKRNLEQSILLCQELQSVETPIGDLDAEGILARMEEMERGGASFHDQRRQDVRKRYIAPVVVTVIVVAFMAAMIWLLLWASRIAPEESPPWWFLLVCIGLFSSIAVGTILALWQRVKEINKGEIDDAKRY